MDRVGIANASPTFWKEILGVHLNGRVIRNIVSNANLNSISQRRGLNSMKAISCLLSEDVYLR